MKCKYEGTGIYEGRCWGTKEIDPCPGYDKCSQFKPNFKTNADYIRSMTDEELVRFLDWSNSRGCVGPTRDCKATCLECITDWLKQPFESEVKNGDKNAHPKERIDALAKYLIRCGVTVQKHGQWEIFLSDYDDCEMMLCSCCGSAFYDGDNDTVDSTPNYCPNCGAKMQDA